MQKVVSTPCKEKSFKADKLKVITGTVRLTSKEMLLLWPSRNRDFRSLPKMQRRDLVLIK
jgi:hypothetical protein